MGLFKKEEVNLSDAQKDAFRAAIESLIDENTLKVKREESLRRAQHGIPCASVYNSSTWADPRSATESLACVIRGMSAHVKTYGMSGLEDLRKFADDDMHRKLSTYSYFRHALAVFEIGFSTEAK